MTARTTLKMKGLILSGGKGTRMRPLTYTSAKQLIPVANKPVLVYGIEAIVAAGIQEIAIITSPETGPEIRECIGNGSRYGAEITYIEQDAPRGLAHAVLTAEPFLGDSPFVMYLGDNLLQHGITPLVEEYRSLDCNSEILLTKVANPSQFGVAELDDAGRVLRLTEKPPEPKSDLALVGVYMFDSHIFEAAKAIKPSKRGELEITDVNNAYLAGGALTVELMGRGFAWFDTGTHDGLLDAANFIRTIESRQSVKIACPEEIALAQGYVGPEAIEKLAATVYAKTEYGRYLKGLLEPDGRTPRA